MDDKFTRRFIVGVSSTSIGTICQVLSGFLCLMITARLISNEQFGYYVIILVIVSLFAMLSSLFLDFGAITKLISSADEVDKSGFVNAAITYKITIDLSICVLILIGKPVLEHFISFKGLAWWPSYVSVLFILGNINSLFVRILQGLHRYKEIALSQAVNGAIKIAAILLFLIYFRMDIKGVIYATFWSYLITSIYQYGAIPFQKKINYDRDLFRQMFRFGFPLGLNNVMSFVFTKVDRFMLGAMLSPIYVAYYEIASKIPECGRTLYDAYQTVFFPSMSELCAHNNHGDAGMILNNSIRILSFASLFATFVLYLFQYELVGALFSRRYLPSSPAVPLLMMVLCLDLTGNMLGTTLVAYGQSDKPVKINIFAALTTVISNLVMIPYFGFIGAAYTCILSRVVTNPINVWYLNKQGIHVDVYQYLKPLFAFAICGALTLIVKPDALYMKLSYIVIFVVMNIMLSVVKAEDIDFIKNGMGKTSKVGNV